MENKLEFYSSKRKLMKSILFSSMIIIIGISCLDSDLLIIIILGYLNLILGAVSLVINLYHLLNHKPQLIVSDLGIEHKKITKQMILWSAISKAEIKKEKNNLLLVLNPKGQVNLEDFKYLFRKTAQSQLKNNLIKLNIEPLAIDHSKLSHFLSSKLNLQNSSHLLLKHKKS